MNKSLVLAALIAAAALAACGDKKEATPAIVVPVAPVVVETPAPAVISIPAPAMPSAPAMGASAAPAPAMSEPSASMPKP